MVIKFDNIQLETLVKDESIQGELLLDEHAIFKLKNTLRILQRMPDADSLRALGSLRFESLDDINGLYAVRAGITYKLIFAIEKDIAIANDVIVIKELRKVISDTFQTAAS